MAKESTELEFADAFIIDNSYETQCTLEQLRKLMKKREAFEGVKGWSNLNTVKRA